MTQKKKPRKQRKTTKTPSRKRFIVIFLLILLFAFLSATLSYFIMKNSNKIITNENNSTKNIIIDKPKNNEELKEFDAKKIENEILKEKEILNRYEEITQEFHKNFDKDEKKIPQENKEVIQEKKETYKNPEFINKKDTYVYDKTTKPKLAIIIDDVSTKYQKDKILDIGYKINMAFLPPTKIHPNSAQIAQDLPFHMIHFPMEASSAFKSEEENTLKVKDSYEKIEKRVENLRKWYPNAIYTNNHTGSVFTENEEAMDKLFKALKKYNFIFVDSRTSAKSVVEKLALKYEMPYIVRNTFIDNEKDFNYIQNQLKIAIDLAKKRGYAIAIGHPHSITLEVLKKSKDLLKDIDTIYINELPYLK